MKVMKKILAAILLIFSILAIIYIIYLKTYYINNTLEEHKQNESSNIAINKVLEEISTNFNESLDVLELKKDNINLECQINNFSLFISYKQDSINTYEFTYHNLTLSTNNKSDEKLNKILNILIKSIQKRFNTEITDEEISNCINTNKCNIININNNQYKLFITEKFKKGND